MNAGSQVTASVTVNQASADPFVISLSSSDTTQITVPSTVTLPAGETTVNFQMTATSSASTEAFITATGNGVDKEGQETVCVP